MDSVTKCVFFKIVLESPTLNRVKSFRIKTPYLEIFQDHLVLGAPVLVEAHYGLFKQQ